LPAERREAVSVSTHVLDAATGRPASGIPVTLSRRVPDGWEPVAAAVTDADGRVADLATDTPTGTYRLGFDTSDRSGFFPEVLITFRITDAAAHHHVPLLLSPFAYSTYRGS
jgi:5-hydroxyisourate hydrolase